MLGNFANCIPPQESERTLRVAQKVERNKPFPKCACGTEHVHPSPCSSIHARYCMEPRITVEVNSATPKNIKVATARRRRVRPPNALRIVSSTVVPREILRALVFLLKPAPADSRLAFSMHRMSRLPSSASSPTTFFVMTVQHHMMHRYLIFCPFDARLIKPPRLNAVRMMTEIETAGSHMEMSACSLAMRL